jgi:hypothetical protein
MTDHVPGMFTDPDALVRSQLSGIFGALAAINLFASVRALVAFHGQPPATERPPGRRAVDYAP